MASAGPLLCGGITVFKPLLMHHITATSRVGVIGIGGLGHIAIKLLHAMGCEVTAFSSNPSKEQAVLAMGANNVVNSRDPEALKHWRVSSISLSTRSTSISTGSPTSKR